MDKRGRKKGNVLRISVVLIGILLGIFAGASWAQLPPPTVVNNNPADGAVNVLINTNVTIQFDMTMDTGASSMDVEDEYGQDVAGTIQWRTTTVTNDTIVFIPQNGLKPSTGYRYECNAQSATGGLWFDASFITKFSMADITPPTVLTNYPYSNMPNAWVGDSIYIRFSEAMNPSSITTAGNITLAGPGIGGTGDYSVNYDIGSGDVEVRKNTPFAAASTYTVTVTTNVRDVRGNPLKNPYSWSFQTGAADITPPTVVKTIPVNGDIKVSASPTPVIYAFFSEKMTEATLNSSNITLHDDTDNEWIPISIFASFEDYVSFGPQSPFDYNHQYTVTIGTGVKDRGGNNGLSSPYPWSFTTALNSGIDSDPILYDGADADEQMGQKWVDGTTRVQLQVSAWDQLTFPLLVTAATPGHASWNLSLTGGNNYSFESTGNEGLTSGNKLVTFTIQDNGSNTVTFNRNIYIFSANPTLSLPANGAAGISTTPTFEWSYSGGDRPLYYNVAVFDGPNPDTASMAWLGYTIDQGSGTHSITIPFDRKLSPNKTYYWAVRAANYDNNGETIGGLWSFTTGGTPPPAPPRITFAQVRSDDQFSGPIIYSLVATVRGVSPADIKELRLDGPSGFRYFFTEDDLRQSEQQGLFFIANYPGPVADGTYTFTLTDSAERTVTTSKNFTFASVPRVSSSSMVPGNNSYLGTTSSTFSWGSVGPGAYYRLLIFDWNGRENTVYISPFTQNTSVTVPDGYLLANTPYKWFVEVDDAPYGNNRSRSDRLSFSTGTYPYDPLTMLNWGIVWSDNDHYAGQRKNYNVNVLGPLPTHVSQVSITGPNPYTFQESNIGYNLGNQGLVYGFIEPGYPGDGNYAFNVQDTFGGSDTSNKAQTSATIGIVDQISMVPANNAYLTHLTPTFSWNAVSGTRYYRVTINDWKRSYTVYQSPRSTSTSFTMPAGILRPGRSYQWRVEAYENTNVIVADNRSGSGWNCFTTARSWKTSFDPDEKSDVATYNTGTGVWSIVPSSGMAPYTVGWGGPGFQNAPGDYDGDGFVDISIYDTTNGVWWITPSSGTGPQGQAGGYGVGWGGSAYKPIPGDFDGDGKTDIAIYETATGVWWILPSSTATLGNPYNGGYGVGWGGPAYKPVLGDFDGDGKTDIAIYDKTGGIWDGAWWIIPSSGTGPQGQVGGYGVGWGNSAIFKPVPADYDGDGKTDIAIYDPTNGSWWILPSSQATLGNLYNGAYGVGWGGPGFTPVPGDYDGDGKADVAIYQPSMGVWYIVPSSGGSTYGIACGGPSDLPVTINLSLLD